MHPFRVRLDENSNLLSKIRRTLYRLDLLDMLSSQLQLNAAQSKFQGLKKQIFNSDMLALETSRICVTTAKFWVRHFSL